MALGFRKNPNVRLVTVVLFWYLVIHFLFSSKVTWRRGTGSVENYSYYNNIYYTITINCLYVIRIIIIMAY